MRALRDRLRLKLTAAISKPQSVVEELEVPIDQCVHFCGFRYGRGEYNPYETYLLELTRKVPLVVARRRFIEFLQYYRPRHMAEALGLRTLSKEYPLWIYPWRRLDQNAFTLQHGWCATSDTCPDILTHFSDEGVRSFRIDEEFVWLERALHSIAHNGYQPENNTSFVSTLQLRSSDNRTTYLLLDGNHRVAAMSALGQKTVRAHQRTDHIITEADCDSWFGVSAAVFTRHDALRLFNAYFNGNLHHRTVTTPARILAPVAWTALYFS